MGGYEDPSIGGLDYNGTPEPYVVPGAFLWLAVWDAAVALNYAGVTNVFLLVWGAVAYNPEV